MQSYKLSIAQFYLQSYRGLSATCWRGLTLNLMESTLVGTFYFLSIYFVQDLYFSVATAGMIVSAYGIGAIMGGYLGGKLSDLISPLMVIAVSMFTQAICYLFLIKLNSTYALFVDVIILGMAGYAFITSNHVWVLHQCRSEKERLKALNMLATCSNLGLGISGMLIGVMAQYGFHNIFLATGLCLALLASYIIVVERNKSQAMFCSSDNVSHYKAQHENIKPNRLTMVMALVSVLFIGSVVSQLGSGYAIYINETFNNMGIEAVSILFTLNSMLVVLFATPVGQYIEQYNKFTMLGVSCFLIGFGMFMLSFSSIFSMTILSCVVYTAGEIIYFSLVQLVCYEAGEKKSKGKSLGIYRVVYGMSRVVGPLTGSAIYSHYSSEMLWYVCGFVGTLCMLGFLYVEKSDTKSNLTIHQDKILV